MSGRTSVFGIDPARPKSACCSPWSTILRPTTACRGDSLTPRYGIVSSSRPSSTLAHLDDSGSIPRRVCISDATRSRSVLLPMTRQKTGRSPAPMRPLPAMHPFCPPDLLSFLGHVYVPSRSLQLPVFAKCRSHKLDLSEGVVELTVLIFVQVSVGCLLKSILSVGQTPKASSPRPP